MADDLNYDDVHFVGEVPDELICIICHVVLKEPVQIMTCGHRYCSECYKQLEQRAEQTHTPLLCPIDREAVLPNTVFPDRAASRRIGSLQVECGNRDRGCTWVSDLRELQGHEQECAFRVGAGGDSGGGEGRDEVLEQILVRLKNCEDDLVVKNTDMAKMKSDMKELRDQNKTKHHEIRMLGLSNAELNASLAAKDRDMTAMKAYSASRDKLIAELKKDSNAKSIELDVLKKTVKDHKQAMSQQNQDVRQLKVKHNNMANVHMGKIQKLENETKKLRESIRSLARK